MKGDELDSLKERYHKKRRAEKTGTLPRHVSLWHAGKHYYAGIAGATSPQSAEALQPKLRFPFLGEMR